MSSIGQNKGLGLLTHQQVVGQTTDALDSLVSAGKRLLVPLSKASQAEYVGNIYSGGFTPIPTGQTLEEEGHEYALFYTVKDSLFVEEGAEPPQLPHGYRYERDEKGFMHDGKASFNLILPDGNYASQLLREIRKPPGASFQQHQTTQVDDAIAQGRVNTTAPNNVASRQLLQGALLQSNFNRSQQVDINTVAQEPAVSKEVAQADFLEGLSGHEYRKDTVDIPSEWENDLSFLSQVAAKNNIGTVGLPEHIRNRKDFLLHHTLEVGGTVFLEDLKPETLMDVDIAVGLMSASATGFHKLPPAMKENPAVQDAAAGKSRYAIQDFPESAKTLEATRRWLSLNEDVIGEYNNFGQAAKEDPAITMQFLQGNKGMDPSLDEIPSIHHGNPDIMAALVTRSEGGRDIYNNLPHNMKEHPTVTRAFVDKKKERYSYRLERSEARHNPGGTHFEKSLVLTQLPKNLHSFIKGQVDGGRTDTLTSGQKDALVTTTEVLAAMDKIFTAENPTSSDVGNLRTLETVLDTINSQGVKMRVAGTGGDSLDTTPVREFDEARMGQLQQLMARKLTSYRRTKVDKLIEKANASMPEHAAIPDPLEEAVFGYTTSHYRQLNRALRSGEISEEQQLYIDGISEGLRQMPSHQGIVWRGTDLPQNIIDLYVPGQEVVEKAFTSTSYGERAAFGGKVTYCIQLKDEGSAGKKVDHLSNSTSEREVLINAGTRFRVLANEQTDTGGYYGKKTVIYLQEI